MRIIKTLSVLFASLLMISSLAGCGSGGGSTSSADNSLPNVSDGGSTGGTATTEGTLGGTATTEGTAATGFAKLTWDPPEAGVAGFKVYYGTSPGTYTSTIDVGTTPSYTISGLPSGSYYFAVTATDSSGNESGFSNEVSKTIS